MNTMMRQTFASEEVGRRVRIRNAYRDHYRAKVWDNEVLAFVPAQDVRAQLVDLNFLVVAGQSGLMWRLARLGDTRYSVLVAPEHAEEVKTAGGLIPLR